MKTAIYPGSFDPITEGHLDIIKRASKMSNHLIVSIIHNPNKIPMFTLKERTEMVKETVKGYKNVTVDNFSGLLVEYAEQKRANVVIKGLRAISDFEYELQMALMNQKLSPEIETVFLMSRSEYSFLSSSLIKEVASLGGSIEGLAPDNVIKAINLKKEEAN